MAVRSINLTGVQFMKKLLIALSVGACLIGSAWAFAEASKDHGYDGRGHQGMRGLHFMEKHLDLSDTQKEQIQAVFAAEKTENSRARPWQSLMALDPDAADYDVQVQRIAKEQAAVVEQKILDHGKQRAQIHAILTPEQRDTLKQLKQRQQNRKQQLGGKTPADQ
jgi:periplasmic protein CpxP/Spy